MNDILRQNAQNPNGYRVFNTAGIRLLTALKRKKKELKGSASQIINGLRWETNFKMDTDDNYVLNDQLGQLWARRLAEENPRFRIFFTFRASRFDRLPSFL